MFLICGLIYVELILHNLNELEERVHFTMLQVHKYKIKYYGEFQQLDLQCDYICIGVFDSYG